MHVGTSTTSRDHLRLATETFITFVYAAAIHIILHTAHELHFGTSLSTSLVVLLVVTFILGDWLSRTRLPWLIPETVSPLRQLVKTVLELVCLYLILFAALTYLDGAREDDVAATKTLYAYIISFLGFTFLWNLHIFEIMKRLSFKELLFASFNGGAVDLPGAKTYAVRYENYRNDVLAKPTYENGKLRPLRVIHGTLVAVTGFVLPQLVALHLSLGNLLPAVILAWHSWLQDRKSLLDHLGATNWLQQGYGWTLSASRHPAFVLSLCGVFVVTLACIVYSRTELFWRPLGSLALLAVVTLAPFHAGREVAVILARLMGAFFVPSIFFMLAADTVEWQITPKARRALKCIGSTLLVLEYAGVLVVCAPAFLPAFVLGQHLLINLFLQYAATPLVAPERKYERGMMVARLKYIYKRCTVRIPPVSGNESSPGNSAEANNEHA